jgi:hypothetical protein
MVEGEVIFGLAGAGSGIGVEEDPNCRRAKDGFSSLISSMLGV